jgi:hypothetical protein
MARTRGFGDIRTSPRNQRLLKWLRRKPVPHTVVGETADGEECKAVVSLTGPTIWADVLSVVRACVHLEAKDKEGQTLRALDLDLDDPELRAESELEAASSRPVPGSVPIISVDIPRLVDNIARNIREASNEAARAQAGAFRDGFSAMTNVVNLCLNLLTRVDDRLAEAEERDRANAQPTIVETAEPADPRQQMAMLALQKAMGGGNGAAPGAGINMAQILQLVQQFQQNQPPAGGDES